MPKTADEKFAIRQRVKLSKQGLFQLKNMRGHCACTRGTVVRYQESPEQVWILRDGRLHPNSYHMDFWQPSR